MEPFGRYRDEIRFFLASVSDQIVNAWPHPVGLGPDVNAGIGMGRRRQLSEVLRGWLGVAEEALQVENEGKERVAVETWRELFG